MTRIIRFFALSLVIMAGAFSQAAAQATSGTISGVVTDERQGGIANATVTARNVGTNESRVTTVDGEGRYRFSNLQVGNYEITIQANGFAKLVRSGVELLLNQDAVVNAVLKPSAVEEIITVAENVSLLNTSNAEVSTRFDTKRLAELPLAPNRNILNVALSAPGVSQLGSGQTGFAQGMNFSVNGMRLRSNNFMFDGQDSNDPSVTGSQQPINNPDVVQELRLVTNQFAAEYGRAAGSVVNVVTKAGTNGFHGSAFLFNNNEVFNARSNRDIAAGFTDAPRRNENQFGGTVGGPIIKDKTFFFGSYQRWTDRQLGAGFTISGVPTAAGRQTLQAVGNRPQVAALLKFLPAAPASNGKTALFSPDASADCNPKKPDENTPAPPPSPSCVPVELGALTGANPIVFNNHQWSARVDHRFSEKHQINGRYFINDQSSIGDGQATPQGLGNIVPQRNQSANIGLTSVLSGTLVNEARVAYQRFGTANDPLDPSSQEIPSIEISQLGLIGFNAAASRTAIGLAVNLPQFRFNNTYQIIDNLSWTKGSHATKFGIDFRRVQVKSFFFPTIRGRLAYDNLETFVDDIASASTINKPVTGGETIQYYNWYDYYFYAQDEWKITPNFSLTYGLRYETPGNSIDSLVPVSDKIVAANGDNQGFAFTPVPKRDMNNFQPRFGFNWNPRTSGDGIIGRVTGGDKLVMRGGYSRTNDYGFININLNIASAFPFVAALSPSKTDAFVNLQSAQFNAATNPLTVTRTIVGEDFRSPYADQFSLEIQRELGKDWVMRVGYVGTKGTALFQTVDGNPRQPTTAAFDSKAPLGSPANPNRVDPMRGVIRLRCNCAASIYHSLQTSLEKRLSRNFSAGFHYTWSSFIDDASELFNPQPQGEIAVAQDSFNRRADRARSSYDRPHRFTGNFVYEFPFFREQHGVAGHFLGGWQANAFFTLQSGAPFTVLNGSDPTGALDGISGLVGNAIRANLNTNLDLSSMNLIEILQAGGASLFSPLASGVRVGNIGRNTLRGDGIANLDFGIIKSTRIIEGHNLQFRAEFYNATNTRNFGTPNTSVNATDFLNQWATNGGNRRIVMALRYTF